MFFRNLTLYRLPAGIDRSRLETALADFPVREPGPMELSCTGFAPPAPNNEAMVRWCGNAAMVRVAQRERILPSSVIADELRKRIDELAEREGRRPGGKERKRLKEAVVSELLPRAFVRPRSTFAYLDFDRGWLVIDTASRGAAEEVVSRLREALGRFPATPPTPEESPRALMTGWLINQRPPAAFMFGDECDLRDPAEAGAKWIGRRVDLESEEIREHIKSGMQAFRLGLVFSDRLSAVIGEDLVIRKLRFLDEVLDQLGTEPAEDAATEFDARFALQVGEVGYLLATLASTFGIPDVATLKLDGGDAPAGMRVNAAMARAVANIAPKPGSGVSSVTISTPHDGKSVTLTAADGKRMRAHAARLAKMERERGGS